MLAVLKVAGVNKLVQGGQLYWAFRRSSLHKLIAISTPYKQTRWHYDNAYNDFRYNDFTYNDNTYNT